MTDSPPPALCHALDPRMEQPVVWQSEPAPGQVLLVRPVSLHDDADLNVIRDWLSSLYPGFLPHQMRLLFELIAESTFMQAFMILQSDNKPLGQLEVYEVAKDEMKEAYPARDGDFRIYVPVSFTADVLLLLLQATIPYFFSFPEVKRLVWVVSVADVVRNRVAARAGFYLPDAGTANVYCIDRPAGAWPH